MHIYAPLPLHLFFLLLGASFSPLNGLFCLCFKSRFKNLWASLVAYLVRSLPAVQETLVQSLGREDPLEKEMATLSSVLAWKIPWTEESGRLQSMGHKSQTWLSDFTFTFFWKALLTHTLWQHKHSIVNIPSKPTFVLVPVIVMIPDMICLRVCLIY